MKKGKMKRLFAAFLAAVVLVTSISPVQLVHAKSQLVNVAPKAAVIVEKEDTLYGGTANHLNDGDDGTCWSWPASDEWPVTVRLDLEQTGTLVSKVVVKLGGGDVEGRTVDVLVQRAQNGIDSDLQTIGEKKDQAMGSDLTFDLDTAVSASDIYVTLSNPKLNGSSEGVAYWPSIREIEVYEEQEIKLSNYNNIADQATISTDGNTASDGPASNLVDGNDGTLYKFEKDQLASAKYVLLSFADERTMDAFRIAFEHVDNEEWSYQYVYSIFAKKTASEEWTAIVENAEANRTDNWQQTYPFDAAVYNEVKIIMHSCTNTYGNGIGWPAIAEFEVYGSEVEVVDNDSIAYQKPVHASSGKSKASNITDGSKTAQWVGDYYPAYVDIDLEENYHLDTVEVYTPEAGYTQYTIYTSMNGRDFEKLAEKTSTDSASLETGEVYQAGQKEARYIRVYVEYHSNSSTAVINEVRATGTPSGTKVQERPEIAVKTFQESDYANASMTAQDTYHEVYGIIERQVGEEYKNWFTLELAENPKAGHDYDYFELTNKDGKIHVKGNDGVSLAMGINHYLKYYCNVNISQVGNQVSMPKSIAKLDKTVFKETKAKVRYSYNYCTLSYSMAFWGEEEWRNELDWLALNGVNVVLDATAQEEVWRRFLGKLGYAHEDIKDFIAGPAYYAWAYMANLSGFGGPVHDSWFEERTEMARKNQLSMRRLGMQPVLQGYSGMVPNDIQNYDEDVQIIRQGTWCSFQRPDMLVTTSETFDEYAALFYECQKEVYGTDNHYYATDPFHEGGNTGGMDATQIAKEVLTSMLAADKDATWIIQAWQGNPSTALLNGLDEVENGASHALVLDLYAEKDPHHGQTGGSYGDTDEFDDTPWLFCMLNNFGGRLGLHGHLDNLANNIPKAFNTRDHIAGIGITPEASVNNPVLYDFIFETVWQDDATQTMNVIDLDEWLNDYATRRYGAESKSAQEAWSILKDTVYKAEYNGLGQGAPESVVNARPALSIGAASTWGNAVISYEKGDLEKAATLLLKDYDKLKSSEGYLYDVANVLQQVLSNSAQEYHNKMANAYHNSDLEAFEKYSGAFLDIIDKMETVTATSEYFLLGRWVEQAKALAKNADDFTKELYEFNAKALVTTWGSINQAEGGGLKDYSNRQWSGLIGDFYKVRWERWIAERTKELKGESASNINWFQWEWEWVRSNKTYPTEATAADLKTLGAEIIKKYTVANPAADNSRDIDPKSMTVESGSFEPNNETEGDPNYVLDGKTNTIWHTAYGGSEREEQYLLFTLDKVTKVDGMRFLQRSGTNGLVTKYSLSVRESESGEWKTIISEGTLAAETSWQQVDFEEVNAKQIKFQVIDAKSTSDTKFGAAAEVRFTAPQAACEKHSYGDWEVSKEASCTEKGEEKRVCKNCNAEETRELPMTDHEYEEEFTVDQAATCKKEGSKSRHCKNPDCDAKTDVTKIKMAHVYGEWETVTAATCTKDGQEKRVCSECQTEDTRTIKAQGHEMGDWVLWEESTDAYEGKKIRTCKNCPYEEVIPRTYKVFDESGEEIDGDEETVGGTYNENEQQAQDGSYSVRVSGTTEQIDKIYVAGKLAIKDKDYELVVSASDQEVTRRSRAAADQVVVKFFESFMKTLKSGKNNIEVQYTDGGVAKTNVVVVKKGEEEKPTPKPDQKPSNGGSSTGSKEYQLLSGANATYNLNTNDTYTMRIDADYDKFANVIKIDGKTVERGNYVTWEGSTYIKFKSDFMHTLSLGERKVEVYFTDGKAVTTINLVSYDVAPTEIVNVVQTATTGTAAPKTGDPADTAMWILLLGACGGTFFFARSKKRKEELA